MNPASISEIRVICNTMLRKVRAGGASGAALLPAHLYLCHSLLSVACSQLSMQQTQQQLHQLQLQGCFPHRYYARCAAATPAAAAATSCHCSCSSRCHQLQRGTVQLLLTWLLCLGGCHGCCCFPAGAEQLAMQSMQRILVALLHPRHAVAGKGRLPAGRPAQTQGPITHVLMLVCQHTAAWQPSPSFQVAGSSSSG